MTAERQLLEILGDGQPHSHREIYAKLRGNPNVASKLRRKGHNIACWREGGQWWYQLRAGEPRPAPAPLADGSVPSVASGQLTFEEELAQIAERVARRR